LIVTAPPHITLWLSRTALPDPCVARQRI